MSIPPREIEPFLFLYINEQCQLRCHHCYMGDRLEMARTMPLENIASLLRYLRICNRQYKVYLLGGEPTLHPEIHEVFRVCKDQGFEVVITSNGLIPERFWSQLDIRNIDCFSFSMDGGSAQVHEAARGRNTFKRLTQSMRMAADLSLQTRAIYTVTHDNRNDVANALKICDEIGLDLLSLHYFTPTGLGQGRSDLQLSPKEWIDFRGEVEQLAKDHKTRVSMPPAFAAPGEMDEILSAGYPGCTARNLERLAVFPDGRVYLCSALFDTDRHYGVFDGEKITPVSRPAGIAGELDIVNTIESNCLRCPSATSCGGGCGAYGHLDHTLPSSTCNGSLVPICPLWSMPISDNVPDRVVMLR